MRSALIHTCAVLVLVALASMPAGAQQTPTLDVEHNDGEINVLGSHLRAKSLPFQQRAGLGLSTRLRIGHSEKGLWISFECEDTRLSATTVDASGDIEDEDRIRVVLRPEAGAPALDLQLSGLGQIRAYQVATDGSSEPIAPGSLMAIEAKALMMGQDAYFTPGTPNQEGLEAWTAGLFLPWSVLGGATPAVGDTWHANFARYDYDADSPAVWSWAEDVGEITFR
jgi:hypothetical protein